MFRVAERYERAAGRGCLYELFLRMLCEHVPELQEKSFARSLGNIEPDVARCFAADLTTDEAELLRRAKRLRDKILHCEFDDARRRLDQMGLRAAGDTIVRVDLPDGFDIMSTIESAIAGSAGTPVRSTDMRGGGFYGWLVEMAQSNSFEQAFDVFDTACELVQRLHEKNRQRMLEAQESTAGSSEVL